MALLDFIKNRNASQQPSVAQKVSEQKPETAKEMYSRQAGQEKAAQKPLDQLPPDQQARAKAIGATLEKATQHVERIPHISPAGPGDNTGNQEALRQNQTGQDKTAPALSPTDAQTGRTAEGNAPAPSKEAPAKTPEKPAGRTQTLPRPRPSWER